MPSSESRSRAYAGRTCGRIAGSRRSTDPRRWDMNTAASSRRWAARCGRSDRGSSSSARSPPPTTRVPTASTATSRRACTASSSPGRGDEGVKRIKDMTKGVGADSVLECVGTQQSMMQAIQCTRRGGYVSYVGVPHGVELNGEELFFAHVQLHGGPAPVRRYLPKLIDQVWNGKINPGKVFDLTLPLDQVGEGYR